jgi:hypothetical protein
MCAGGCGLVRWDECCGLVGGCASVLASSCCVCGDDLVCSGLCIGLLVCCVGTYLCWGVGHGMSLVFSLSNDG